MVFGTKKTALVTGCTKGSIGDALAREFLRRGYHVIATARSLSSIEHFKPLGIQIVELDVTSDESIERLRSQVTSLDVLFNNAGQVFIGPLSDTPMSDFRRMFEVNVYSIHAITQAMLPLLIQSKGIIVNHGSQNSQVGFPSCGAYSASKAAVHMISDTLRVELQPFGIRVVYLITGAVQSNITMKQMRDTPAKLPANSLYSPIRDELENVMGGATIRGKEQDTDQYARQVIADLLDRWSGTPKWIWRGTGIGSIYFLWFISCFWKGIWDPVMRQVAGLHLLKARLNAVERKK